MASHTTVIAGCLLAIAFFGGCMGRVEGDEDKPFDVKIRCRDSWPRGVPVRVCLEYGGLSFLSAELRVVADPTFPGGNRIKEWVPPQLRSVHYTNDYLFSDRTDDIGLPPGHSTSLEFQASVKDARFTVFNTKWRGRIVVPLRIVDNINEVLSPVESEELDTLLSEELHPVVTRHAVGDWRGQDGPWFIRVKGVTSQSDLVKDLTFAVQCEVLRNDEIVATANGWWQQRFWVSGRPILKGQLNDVDSLKLQGDLQRINNIDTDDARWELRVLPDPIMALRNFKCDRYWCGELRFPLRVVVTSGTFDLEGKKWNIERKLLYDGDQERSTETQDP